MSGDTEKKENHDTAYGTLPSTGRGRGSRKRLTMRITKVTGEVGPCGVQEENV